MIEIFDHIKGCKGKKAKPKKEKRPRPERVVRQLPPFPLSLPLHHEILSQNAHVGRHWSAKNSEKLAWVADLRPSILALRLEHARFPWSSWRITRHIQHGQRAFDYANLVGGCKQLVDALKAPLNIIEDDDPAHFLCEYEQERITDPLTGVFGTIELLDVTL